MIDDSEDLARVIIDSGAAVTVTSWKDYIHDYSPYGQDEMQERTLEGPSKEALAVKGEGVLKLKFGNYLKEIQVIYSPDVPDTLISLGALDHGGVSLVDKRLICDDSIDHIDVYLEGQMFMINKSYLQRADNWLINSVEATGSSKITSRKYSLQELHEILGHVNVE